MSKCVLVMDMPSSCDMYELGYDMRDIREREKHEKYLCEKSSILENLCEQRGIKLWERKGD